MHQVSKRVLVVVLVLVLAHETIIFATSIFLRVPCLHYSKPFQNYDSLQASDSYLDLGHAPYVLYGVKYIDLVSLAFITVNHSRMGMDLCAGDTAIVHSKVFRPRLHRARTQCIVHRAWITARHHTPHRTQGSETSAAKLVHRG